MKVLLRKSKEIDNSLIVSGPVLDVNRFVTTSKGFPWQIVHSNQDEQTSKKLEPQFCFNSLVPMPKEIYDHLKEPVEKGANISVGVDWMLKNWGTCPDIYGDDVITDLDGTQEEARFFITFDTMNCPDNWVIAVAKQFPSLVFYLECIDLVSQVMTMRLCCKGEMVKYLSCEDDEDE